MGLCDASTLTQLLHNCTFKIASLVHMQSCWETKPEEDVFQQYPSHRSSFLVSGGIGLRIAGEVISNNEYMFYNTFCLF